MSTPFDVPELPESHRPRIELKIPLSEVMGRELPPEVLQAIQRYAQEQINTELMKPTSKPPATLAAPEDDDPSENSKKARLERRVLEHVGPKLDAARTRGDQSQYDLELLREQPVDYARERAKQIVECRGALGRTLEWAANLDDALTGEKHLVTICIRIGYHVLRGLAGRPYKRLAAKRQAAE